ncbi:20070_t:CDS:2 [Cetraspora pellucida]|uniref:20070_t:CDS:1 n=1 Tax=Cetraspora pellucida TaxID=1433469 RepID=A0A9N9J0E6_9GLOM|nr:20070_t:CDS:2 [Cetraspora pellucida]
MSSTTKDNNTSYRDGCMSPGYKSIKNSFIGNLLRKLTLKPSKSGRPQDETKNTPLTNPDSINSTINNKKDDAKLRTPRKVKVKSDHKGKYIPIEIPITYNEQVIDNSSPYPHNRPKDIHQLERKVDALGSQLNQIEQMLSSLVQSPKDNNSIKVNLNSVKDDLNSVKDTLNNDEKNDKDNTDEIKNTTKENLNSQAQNVTPKSSANETSKNSTKTNVHIRYCNECGRQKLLDEWCEPFWERYTNVNVALKSLLELNEEDFTSEIFKELKSHLMSNDQVVGRFNILRTYGITRDPDSKIYMIVMTLADDGDLSAYLKKHFSSLTFIKRLDILYDMATGLCQIHKSGLMHRDLHSGNVMCQRLNRGPGRDEEYRFVIGDLGQATPPKKDDTFGDVAQDPSLILEICSGLRPEIPSNTPKLYADLMQRCWSNNIEKRPSAQEIYSAIGTWLNQCLFVPNSNIAKEFEKGDEYSIKTPRSQKLHPNNVLYSTYHDVKALTTNLDHFGKEDSKLDIMDNDFEIPDSIDDEDSTFEIPDSFDEVEDSLDEAENSLDEVEDSIDNIDLDDIPITPTDESSVLNKLNIEDIKKEIVSKPSPQPISSTNDDVQVKENDEFRYSYQSMGSVKFEFSISDLED